jgi:hypothetical protein
MVALIDSAVDENNLTVKRRGGANSFSFYLFPFAFARAPAAHVQGFVRRDASKEHSCLFHYLY